MRLMAITFFSFFGGVCMSRKWKGFVFLLFVFLLIFLCLYGSYRISSFLSSKKPDSVVVKTTTSHASLATLSDEIERIANKSKPSILWINSNASEDAFGTGFVIEYKNKKYVLTNHHVVESDGETTAYLSNDKEVTMKIVGYDLDLDLAILAFEKEIDIPALSLASSKNVSIGDFVIAIGHPLGLDYSTTFGIISATKRDLQLDDTSFKNLLQTDAAINPGNSGGPLFNLDGKVIGINTAIMEDSQGLGFAVPSTDISSVLDELIANGSVKRPFLGVHITDTTKGIGVVSVYPNSPAEKSGIKKNDIIKKIDGHSLKDAASLTELVNDYKVGDNINVNLLRNSKTYNLNVSLDDKNTYVNK
ncbi:peptidase S1 [Priestia megaterium]|nr:peptidase S1 [Priestia megaterium]